MEASNIKIGVGLYGGADDEALLGQSFLSKFDITLGKDLMVLKPRQHWPRMPISSKIRL